MVQEDLKNNIIALKHKIKKDSSIWMMTMKLAQHSDISMQNKIIHNPKQTREIRMIRRGVNFQNAQA